jgi:thiamine biosynthesis protein ThiI
MKPDAILLRLGELTLKGRNRHRFEQQVLSQIQRVLKPYAAITYKRAFGRMYIDLNNEPFEPIAAKLKNVFGIHSFSPVYTCTCELQSIQEKAVAIMLACIDRPTRFKVDAKRADKEFPYDSLQLRYHVGGYVLQHVDLLSVDLHHPERILTVEVREDRTYLFVETIEGLRGFPAGSNGKAVVMLSGGIDSPVAAWMSLRQGLRIEAIHFHSYPYTSKQAQDKVISLGNQLTEYVRELNLHMIDFTEIQLYLKQNGQENLLVTLMRRAMMRIAERIVRETNSGAIVTGESLGQVASQTLPGITASSENIQVPILRPVMMMDKQEIIDLARRIGTFDISIQPYEDCCTLFVPKSPATNPNLKVLRAIERQLIDLDRLIEKAVQTKEVLTLPRRVEENFSELL